MVRRSPSPAAGTAPAPSRPARTARSGRSRPPGPQEPLPPPGHTSSLTKPGEKLPTTRELADQYETSGVTVRKAVELLIEAGVLEGRQGIGVFVAEKPGRDS
ncbi:GntR family transcriptional regulator [Solwaraspora sp. WMMD1047]|nr:GntR family transcriptional regulator [Solwaraspora sp. WMMD1047]MDG4829354.1 GntR family transcriptional regulator [Solwaraspora sp. WMMD1047]